MDKPVRVLVVDDSLFARTNIGRAITSGHGITVAGHAINGIEAIAQTKALRPDVITLDVSMPEMDGLTALERIMAECPTPVVMLSALTTEQASATVRALELGAVDFFPKTSVVTPAGSGAGLEELQEKIRSAGRLTSAGLQALLARRKRAPAVQPPARVMPSSRLEKLVVIGSSTGGPGALVELFSGLHGVRNAAFLVVQHMPAGFTTHLAARLNTLGAVEVREAREKDTVRTGLALLAPGGWHMTVDRTGVVGLNQEPPVCGVRPAVNNTLSSVAKAYGARTLAVILTGMGVDGTEGCRELRAAGGDVIVEDESTAVVFGMPKSVRDAGLARAVLPLPEIAGAVLAACARAGRAAA